MSRLPEIRLDVGQQQNCFQINPFQFKTIFEFCIQTSIKLTNEPAQGDNDIDRKRNPKEMEQTNRSSQKAEFITLKFSLNKVWNVTGILIAGGILTKVREGWVTCFPTVTNFLKGYLPHWINYYGYLFDIIVGLLVWLFQSMEEFPVVWMTWVNLGFK